MAVSVTINFGDATAAGNRIAVSIGQGSIALDHEDGVALNLSSGATNFSASPTGAWIATPEGAELRGMLTLALALDGASPPSVTLDGVGTTSSSPATVTWPTADGLRTAIIEPGSPLVLSGFAP